MKVIFCISLILSMYLGGMNHERRLSAHHDEMPPIIINLPSSKDPHRFIVYEERSDHDQIEAIKQTMERKIEPPKPETPSIESRASDDSVTKGQHRKWLLITNAITGISTAAISAGVSITIIYLNQRCGTNITTPPQG